jgi:hypothetical protein
MSDVRTKLLLKRELDEKVAQLEEFLESVRLMADRAGLTFGLDGKNYYPRPLAEGARVVDDGVAEPEYEESYEESYDDD